MKILYIDGGCSGNGQLDISKRKMVSVVADETGEVLIESRENGGSNNGAEFTALHLALNRACISGLKDIEIRTDSRNNIAWFKKKGSEFKGINNPLAIKVLKQEIEFLKDYFNEIKLVWIPREQNLAGHYIENKYKL